MTAIDLNTVNGTHLMVLRSTKLELDSAGLLMHAAECGVTDGVDDDADCTCGAHAINQRLVEVERLKAELIVATESGERWYQLWTERGAEVERLRAVLDEIAAEDDE